MEKKWGGLSLASQKKNGTRSTSGLPRRKENGRYYNEGTRLLCRKKRRGKGGVLAMRSTSQQNKPRSMKGKKGGGVEEKREEKGKEQSFLTLQERGNRERLGKKEQKEGRGGGGLSWEKGWGYRQIPSKWVLCVFCDFLGGGSCGVKVVGGGFL